MRFIYLLLACTIGITACINTSNKTTSVDDTLNKSASASDKLPTSSLNDNGTQTLLALVNKYYVLKDAFIAIKAPRIDSAAQELLIVTDSLRSLLQVGKTQLQLVSYTDTMIANTKAILLSKDVTCDEQRQPFSKLSDAFFILLKKVQLKNANVYQQHCPMALNEKGANWLSNESEIKNPYYGKKMLECGDITDSLK
jgi:hypothetical protein